MGHIRKPFQGVWNIVRFNWHFYLLSFALVIPILLFGKFLGQTGHIYTNILSLLIVTTTIASLCVSYYVYDLSHLYTLNWLDESEIDQCNNIININAGFDETSALLNDTFHSSKLIVLDFYDPLNHTEVSIKRARKVYPPYPGTIRITTTHLPLENNYADRIFVILSAHEIRKEAERVVFFKELKRVIKPNGKIFVVEHLRDLPNFAAFNIGFFHFMSKSSWEKTFRKASLVVSKITKVTSFISVFILQKHDSTS